MMTIRERIRQWLVGSLEQQIAESEARIMAALQRPAVDEAQLTAADMMKPVMMPFRINRVPGRKLRAELEWKNSPEFRKQQEQIRETRAKQPNGH